MGTIKDANDQYTTIVFDDHGTRKFLSAMVQLEHTDDPAPRRPARRGDRAVVRPSVPVPVEQRRRVRHKSHSGTTAEIASIVPELDTLAPNDQNSPDDAAHESPTRPDSTLDRSARKREHAVQDPAEVRAAIAEMNATHYATWPDAPLPALDGQTPRTALQTEDGRQRVEALLTAFEESQGSDRPRAPDYDFNQLRAALGLPLRSRT
ncbi:MAG TPA: MbcA/ParS/Xre antitoxin family protein [Candidatus Polarisedimenticolaceae bacterium]|nr:MbcA/ParS/Xre antitoxin family protein [Candidatus Polarisedimenticolaceae bacterium]